MNDNDIWVLFGLLTFISMALVYIGMKLKDIYILICVILADNKQEKWETIREWIETKQ